MDIRKEWESCLSTTEVINLFEALKREEGTFRVFENLTQFISVMKTRSPEVFQIQDECLWTLVRLVQTSSNKQAEISLLTYLLAPGLQNILREMIHAGTNIRDLWSDVWWEFFQTVMSYPIDRRRQKVAANLLMDARKRLIQTNRTELKINSVLDSLDKHEVSVIPRFDDPFYNSVSQLLEGKSIPGVTEEDIDLIIGSRVYDEDLHDVAGRLTISYDAARKRRQRVEKKLRDRWLKEN